MRALLFALLLAPPASADDAVPTAVRNAVRIYGSDRVACLARAARRDDTLAGSVTIAATVAEHHVVDTELVDDTVGSEVLSRCLLKRMRRWRVPGDGGDGTWPLRFPFEA